MMNRPRVPNQGAILDRVAPDNAVQFLLPYRSFTRVNQIRVLRVLLRVEERDESELGKKLIIKLQLRGNTLRKAPTAMT